MKTIYKYKLLDNFGYLMPKVEIKVPKNGKILSIKIQHNIITIWILVNTENIIEKRNFIILGTGYTYPEGIDLEYIGTVITKSEDYVFHVFEEIQKNIS